MHLVSLKQLASFDNAWCSMHTSDLFQAIIGSKNHIEFVNMTEHILQLLYSKQQRLVVAFINHKHADVDENLVVQHAKRPLKRNIATAPPLTPIAVARNDDCRWGLAWQLSPPPPPHTHLQHVAGIPPPQKGLLA